MTGLNPQQQTAVEQCDTPLLVLAGAGSGKTRVITQKIAHLIGRRGVPARHIFAVTFTNKAAQEMKQRVARLIPADAARGLHVSTFHTLGLRMLHEDGARLGYRRGFTIMDATDSLVAMKELAGDGGLVDEEAIRWQISRWKNDFVQPEQALHAAGDDFEQRAARLYARYQTLLHAYNAVDFDDLILLPVRLLCDYPELEERWQNRVRHLLVDEYQDTNAVQYELVKRLVGRFGAFTAVGDDDQSVYAWRGARPENLARLQDDFSNLKLVKLEQNYRSTGRILRCANRLIGNNPHLFEKRLWSAVGEGAKLRVVALKSAEDEADYVAAEILSHRYRSGGRWRDYAVLYRGNFQSRTFEKALREKQIPYLINGGPSFYERAEIRDVLAYLRLLVNPDDDTAFLRVVNTPRREIGATTLEKLGHYAREREIGMLAASAELGLAERLQPRARERLARFAEWLARFARRADGASDPAGVASELLDEINYEGWLRDSAQDPKAAQKRWDNVTELLESIARIAAAGEEPRSLAEVVAKLTLFDILDRQSDDDEDDAVTLMTLHAAKGLEFPSVFMVGMEEELLPHRSAIEEDNIEEERRLCYVGITRAQRQLTLSHATRRKKYGELIRTEPSRFLDELPEEDLHWVGGRRGDEIDKAAQQEAGQHAIAGLRALLKRT